MIKVDLRTARNSLAGLAYQHILDLILAQELRPGQRLSPQDLAEAMGISPTPVKQALARLTGEGLLEASNGSGLRVVNPSEDEIRDLYNARLMCELHALREGFTRVDDEFLARSRELARQCEEALASSDTSIDYHEQLARADRDFHANLVSLLANKRIQTWYLQLNVHLRTVQWEAVEVGRPYVFRRDETVAEHRAIQQALEKHDLSAASKALRQHLTKTRDGLVAMQEQRRRKERS